MRYLIVLGIVFLVVFIPAAISLYMKSRQEKAKLKPKEEEKKIELLGLFDWIRKYAAVPILYTLLVGFLWYIEWTREMIKQNFGLILIAVIAMALTPFLLEYKQKPEERVKSQKLVNSIYSLFVISVIGLVLALNFGWISKKTPEEKVAETIKKHQMDLEMKPIMKEIEKIEKEASKRLLTESEKKEIETLKDTANKTRRKYELKKSPEMLTIPTPAFSYKEKETIKAYSSLPKQWKLCWTKTPSTEAKRPELRKACYPAKIIRQDDKLVFEMKFFHYGKQELCYFHGEKTGTGTYEGTWYQDEPEDHGTWLLEPTLTGFVGWIKGRTLDREGAAYLISS